MKTLFHENPRLIRNFPKNYPWYKKVLYNIVCFISGIVFYPRKNRLTKKDVKKAKKVLKKGDILLLGNLRTVFSVFVGDAVTHSALFLGGGRGVIHSIENGVGYRSMGAIFKNYDTLAILRLPRGMKGRKRVLRKVKKLALSHFGKPYDFEFKNGPGRLFCAELVNEAYIDTGYDTGLETYKERKDVIERIEGRINGANFVMRPKEFVQGNFEVVFLSHNLEIKNGELLLKD